GHERHQTHGGVDERPGQPADREGREVALGGHPGQARRGVRGGLESDGQEAQRHHGRPPTVDQLAGPGHARRLEERGDPAAAGDPARTPADEVRGPGAAPDHHVQERHCRQQRQILHPLHHRGSVPSAPSSPATWSPHSPNTSRVWSTSVKPFSWAIASIELSSFGARNSTVRPHSRHTRWWWCPVSSHWRYSDSPSPATSTSRRPERERAWRFRYTVARPTVSPSARICSWICWALRKSSCRESVSRIAARWRVFRCMPSLSPTVSGTFHHWWGVARAGAAVPPLRAGPGPPTAGVSRTGRSARTISPSA